MAPGKPTLPIQERKKTVLSLFSKTLATKYFGFEPTDLDKCVVEATNAIFKKDEATAILDNNLIKMPSVIQNEKKQRGEKIKAHPLFRFDPHWIYNPKHGTKHYTEEILDCLTDMDHSGVNLGYCILENIECLEGYEELDISSGSTSMGGMWDKKYKLDVDFSKIMAEILERLQEPVIKQLVLKLFLKVFQKKKHELKDKTKFLRIVRR